MPPTPMTCTALAQSIPAVQPNAEMMRCSALAILQARSRPQTDDNPLYCAAARRVLNFMYTLWRNDRLCDVVLKTQDDKLKAHKVALAAYSDALDEKLKEFSSTDVIAIDLQDFDRDVVQTVLHFIYTVEIDLNIDNIGPILACAIEVGIDIITYLCKEFLWQYTVDTALVCYFIAEQVGWEDITECIYRTLCTSFIQIVQQDDFLRISLDLLLRLLSDDCLVVCSELDVFFAMARWIDSCRIDRFRCAASLLQCVRLQLICPEILVSKVEAVDFIFSEPDTHMILYEAFKYHALRLSCSKLMSNYCTQKVRRIIGTPGVDCCPTPCAPTPCKTPCPAPCPTPCPAPCTAPCPAPCPAPCSAPCPPPCPAQCPAPCPPPCPAPCSVPCPPPCLAPCPAPCPPPCPVPCSVPCPVPCSAPCPPPCPAPCLAPCPVPCSVPCPAPCLPPCPSPCQASQPPCVQRVLTPCVPPCASSQPVRTYCVPPCQSPHMPCQPACAPACTGEPAKQQTEKKSSQTTTCIPMCQPACQTACMSACPPTYTPAICLPACISPYKSKGQLRLGGGVGWREGFGGLDTAWQEMMKNDGEDSERNRSMNARYNLPTAIRERMWGKHSLTRNLEQRFSSTPRDDAPRADADYQGAAEVADCLLTVGGIDLQTVDESIPGRLLTKLDEDSWSLVTYAPHYVHHHRVVRLQGNIYLIGGAIYNHLRPDLLGTATDRVHVYHPATDTWSEADPMREKRAYHGVALMDGYIYTVGGEDDQKRKLDTIERYDPQSNSWNIVARMPGGGKLGPAVHAYKDLIYIIGGYNNEAADTPVLDSVECYDPVHGNFLHKNPLHLGRCHAGIAVVQGRMYLVGGRTRDTYPPFEFRSLRDVDVYSEEEDSWQIVTYMKEGRHDAGCTAIDSRLYIVGGMVTPHPHCLDSVECYDLDKSQWLTQPPLVHPAAGIECCSLTRHT